jgi:hypothetical protein
MSTADFREYGRGTQVQLHYTSTRMLLGNRKMLNMTRSKTTCMPLDNSENGHRTKPPALVENPRSFVRPRAWDFEQIIVNR